MSATILQFRGLRSGLSLFAAALAAGAATSALAQNVQFIQGPYLNPHNERAYALIQHDAPPTWWYSDIAARSPWVAGHLARIDDENTQNWIMSAFDLSVVAVSGSSGAWIGASDRDTPGTFQWVGDPSAPFDYANWGANEPDQSWYPGAYGAQLTPSGQWISLHREWSHTSNYALVEVPRSLALTLPTVGDDSHPTESGYQVAITLTARGILTPVNGFQAFLEYDTASFNFRADLSSYDEAVFDSHISQMASAEVTEGKIHLDGTTLGFDGPPSTSVDTVLATLVFDAIPPVCYLYEGGQIRFTEYLGFKSELSYFGVPLETSLAGPTGNVDTITPVVECREDIVVNASPTGGSVSVSLPPLTVADNFAIQGVYPWRSDNLPLDAPFPIGTTVVQETVWDWCGNARQCVTNVTVLPYFDLQATIEMPGSQPGVRCVTVMVFGCEDESPSAEVETDIELVDHDFDPLTPVRFSGPVPCPIGTWTRVNVKDRQHTKWGSGSDIGYFPTTAVAESTIVLLPGDNDDDGDVDINDLTWLVSTFGSFGAPACDPTIQRDADFSNDGAVYTEDFSLLSEQWLTVSQFKVGCTAPATAPPTKHDAASKLDRRTRVPTTELQPSRRNADLNGDGVFDWRDVERVETSLGLKPGLSQRMRTSS